MPPPLPNFSPSAASPARPLMRRRRTALARPKSCRWPWLRAFGRISASRPPCSAMKAPRPTVCRTVAHSDSKALEEDEEEDEGSVVSSSSSSSETVRFCRNEASGRKTGSCGMAMRRCRRTERSMRWSGWSSMVMFSGEEARGSRSLRRSRRRVDLPLYRVG